MRLLLALALLGALAGVAATAAPAQAGECITISTSGGVAVGTSCLGSGPGCPNWPCYPPRQ